MRTLEGGCSAPVAAHAEVTGDSISLEGGVWSLDGKEERRERMERKLEIATADAKIKTEEIKEYSSVVVSGSMIEQEMMIAEDLGERMAKKLLEQGAGKILSEAKAANAVN